MPATPMRSTDFRSIVEPILNEEFDGIYDQRADEYKQVFKERNGIARAYHEEPVMFGMGTAPELPDGTPVTYQAGGILYNARYFYKVYGLAFAITKVLVEDGDHIRIGQTFATHLAQSMIETEETNGANIVNRAFTGGAYIGGDGVALCVSNHPTASGSSSNILTTSAALSQTSLEQFLIQVRNATDSQGKRISLKPDSLVISPSNQYQAEVLLKSALRTGTTNNDINPIKSMGALPGGMSVISRMTSTTQWGLKMSNVPKGLQKLNRRKMERTSEGDFETDSMRYKATARYIFGWTDWRDFWSTPGT